MSRKNENRPADGRTPIARAVLEKALTEAVKTGHPECETFVGVIVERITPTARGAPNWAVKGVKFGKASRERCGALLTSRVEEALLEFHLSD
jgi:hypothetical protein